MRRGQSVAYVKAESVRAADSPFARAVISVKFERGRGVEQDVLIPAGTVVESPENSVGPVPFLRDHVVVRSKRS